MPSYSLLAEVGPKRQAEGNTPSASPIYKAEAFKDADLSIAGVSTLYEMFDNSVKKFGSKQCLGWRPIVDDKAGDYEWWTYEETANKVATVASGMATTGLAAGSKVGVLGPNCPEWMLAMQACNRMSLVCVPLYDTLGENAIEYIVNHSESQLVFVAASKLSKFVAALPACKSTLKTVVYWGKPEDAHLTAMKESGLNIKSIDEVMAAGQDKTADPIPPKAEDLCTIMYTSGTTGDPKGVMLTHKAVVKMVASTKVFMARYKSFGENDTFLSYLPLAHIFDRSAEELFLALGGRIAYWQGNILTLVDDISAAKPTLFAGVPRVFDRIYAGVMKQANSASSIKKFLFKYGFERKLNFLKSGYAQDKASPIFDKVVFSKRKNFMMKVLIALSLLFVCSALARDEELSKRGISFCSALGSDGYYCDDDGSHLYYCNDNDNRWQWACAAGCTNNSGLGYCNWEDGSDFCQGKFDSSDRSGYGSYCDRSAANGQTRVACWENGRQFTYDCTSTDEDATCRESSFFNYAYCEYPPKCETFPQGSESTGALDFCSPSYLSPAERDSADSMVPVDTVENPTVIGQQDEHARLFSENVSGMDVYRDYVDQCGYLMDSAGCYVAFPDCPGHEECVLVCHQMINCVQAAAAANSNTSANPTLLDCESYCSEFAAGSLVSYSFVLLAIVAIVSVLF